ncbi:CAP domain-containing protein [Bacillus sp. AFS088145]|uniref:CAP domain-containing protein n=1 Tax=Bacillus sp. AFS088145 TaxID=2033514 RepID=UPI002571316E|nr:CAP domain-containing protein [Bacillus sp. AFS088145]
MKKVISLSTLAATLLVGAPVTAVHADTINKDTKAYTQKVDLNNVLFSYFNLPSLNTTNGKIDLSKFGIDMTKLQDSIKQQLEAQLKQGNSSNTTTKPTVPTTPATPAKPSTPTTKPTVPTTPSKPTTPSTSTPSTPSKPATSTPSDTTSNSASLSAYESKVVDLTNAERTKAGLKPFTVNATLSKTARLKSQDMTDKNYFDHTSPTYGSPFDMMKQFGITYSYAAENIAKGQKTPEEVVTAWMNSAGHRANILNPNLTQIGVGYDSRSNAWTQQFIGK